MPTLQTLERRPLAVSKSIAAKLPFKHGLSEPTLRLPCDFLFSIIFIKIPQRYKILASLFNFIFVAVHEFCYFSTFH
jgi:hypothetical protein